MMNVASLQPQCYLPLSVRALGDDVAARRRWSRPWASAGRHEHLSTWNHKSSGHPCESGAHSHLSRPM